jgi:hypothetical protein
MNAGQVVVVGLDKRIAALTEVLAGERMDQADVVADAAEGIAGKVMITPGAFDSDHQSADVMVGTGALQLVEGSVQLDAVVGDFGGWDEDVAVEVTEHPFEAGFGTIDADDAKVLGPDGLHAGVNDAAGLVNDAGKARAGASTTKSCGCHGNTSRERETT